jgi:hypothetical protein
MSTKKEERERMRQERLAAQQAASSSERRRLILGYVVAGLIVAAILAGIFVVITGGDEGDGTSGDIRTDTGDSENCHIEPLSGSTNDFECDGREGTPPPELTQGDLEAAAAAANCELQLDLKDEGNDHIEPDAKPPDYKTNPPTSGDHVVSPLMQADGAYVEKPDDIFIVHALEHGRIEIQYSPDLPEEDQLALKGVFDESPDGMLLFPNPDMPYEVATTAWAQLMGCDTYDGEATLDAIRDFRDIYRGNGPEPVPITLSG